MDLAVKSITLKMPKVAATSISKVKSYATEFPTEFQATPKGQLHCKLCGTIVVHDRRSNVLKHRDSAKHRKAVSLQTPKQSLLSSNISPREQFIQKVTKAFLSADIPLHKLNNPAITDLFQYLGHIPPSETSCRSRVNSLAEEELNSIIEGLTGKQIFMVIDEAEVSGQKFVNTLVGNILEPGRVFLISCKVRCQP